MIFSRFGRGERIRTSGLYVPNVALYQAKLHPDCGIAMHLMGVIPLNDFDRPRKRIIVAENP
jgi:hypothetical protein